jgi:hypothetical protein
MNLLCPNCQKMLTVPEQYAGQLMKCPLCNGTFTVPTLPASAPAPPPPPPPLPTTPAAPDIFGFKDPLPPPPTTAPAPPPAPGFTAPAPGPSLPPPPPPLPPGEYTRKMATWLSPKILQFVPPVALFFVFIFQFFTWVGVYPGGYAAATQNAWQVIWGGASEDPNMKKVFHLTTDAELAEANKDVKDDKDKMKDNRPGWGLLMILYLLCFFPVFALTVACAALGLVPLKLPPAVASALPWRWGIAFLLNLFVFFVLTLQLIAGFPLESTMRAVGEAEAAKKVPTTKRDAVEEVQYKVIIGAFTTMVERTTWLYLAYWLHLLVVFVALLLFWLSQRERFNKPLPVIELRW